MFENASKLIGFRALNVAFCKKILNYDFQVRDGATKNALDIEIMFTKCKKGVYNLFSTFSNIFQINDCRAKVYPSNLSMLNDLSN